MRRTKKSSAWSPQSQKKSVINIIGIIAGLALLILVHELGHFFAAKRCGIAVEEFGIGFPPRLFSVTSGETRYSVNALPLGGFVRLKGEMEDAGHRSFMSASRLRRAFVLVAGVCMNFVAGWLLLAGVFWIGIPPVVVVDRVFPASPAAFAGIQPGDVIRHYTKADDFISFINSRAGREVSFAVLRAGEEVHVRAIPRQKPPKGEGALGVVLQEGGVPASGFIGGLARGWEAALAGTAAIVRGLGGLFTMPQDVVGPVGIFTIALGASKAGVAYALQLLGIISLNLAVLNLLPIPALDGGRLLFLAAEAVRGRQFPPKLEMRANAFGFLVLIFLILLVTFKDIANLF
jgi:regulator of sigma E protease